MRGPQRGSVPIRRPKSIPGPETSPWYWHPGRCGVKSAPEWFKERLADLPGELEITWNPINERWQLWSRAPRIQHKICQGWRLLFVHNGPSGEHLPLDERIFARLYASSTLEHGSAKAYFDRIESEARRDEEKREKNSRQDAIDHAMPFWDHSQIKVSMCGPSSGSKFSDYHA